MATPLLLTTARRAAPKAARVRASDLPKGAVRNPGEKGYHGPHGDDPDVRSSWQIRSTLRNSLDNLQDDSKFNRKWGRINYGLAGGMAASGIAGGVAMDQIGRRQARRIKAGQYDRGIVKKVWEPSMPFVRAATRSRKAVYDVSSMPRKQTREQRFAEWASRESPAEALMIGGSAIGSGAFVTGAASHASRLEDARKKRRAQLRRTGAVTKRFQPKLVGNALRHPSEMRRVIRENPWEAGIAAGGVGLGAAAGARDRNHPGRTAAAGAGGAVAGQLGYYGAGFGAISRAETLKRRGQKQGYNGLSRSAQEAIWRKHRLEHGVHQGEKMTVAQQSELFRNYPKQLPGWRHQRFAAQLQRGKYGRAILAGATLGGAAMVGGASARGRKQPVGKALYAREDRVSPIRAVELAAGGTLVAYGLGHSGVVGRAIGRGIKIAQRNGNEEVAEALLRAQAARGSIRAGMAPGEAALRRIKAVDDAIRKVPRPLRAEAALVAGGIIGSHAMPVRRTHYTPVSSPVPAYSAGW